MATKEELIKDIFRNCLMCQGMNEDKIDGCDLLSCPLHRHRNEYRPTKETK